MVNCKGIQTQSMLSLRITRQSAIKTYMFRYGFTYHSQFDFIKLIYTVISSSSVHQLKFIG